jgi:hypothetical protein
MTYTFKVPGTMLAGDFQACFYETAQAGNIEHCAGPGFHRNTLLVESGNAGASRIEGKPVLTQRAIPHYTRQSFWIGLPVVLFISVKKEKGSGLPLALH